MSSPRDVSGQRAPALATRRNNTFARVAVDVANTAFWEGKEYRISRELAIPAGQVVTLRFTSLVDFILQRQELAVDLGRVKFTAWRDEQGVEGGTWSPVPIYRVNFMDVTPVAPNQAQVDIGGTFTPNEGESAVETIRIRTAGSTAQRTSITGAIGDERGLAPGTYYLRFDAGAMGGNEAAAGVFALEWEERP